jgi:hypothetical protein
VFGDVERLRFKVPYTITNPIWAVDKLDDMVVWFGERNIRQLIVQDTKLQDSSSVPGLWRRTPCSSKL